MIPLGPLLALLTTAPPQALLVATLPEEGRRATLLLLRADEPATRRPIAELPVARGVAPKVAIAPDGASLAVLRRPDDRPGITGALLERLDPATGARTTLDEEATMLSRPLFGPDGTLWWLRVGRRDEPSVEASRRGELQGFLFRLVRLRPGGAPEVVAEEACAGLHLVAADEGGPVLYRVHARDGATLERLADGKLRRLATLPGPWARDFSLGADGRLLLSTLLGGKSARHALLAVSLKDGAIERRVSQDGVALPALAAGPDVLFGTARGLSAQRLVGDASAPAWPALSGPFLAPVAASADGNFAAVERRLEGRALLLLDRAAGRVTTAELPQHAATYGFLPWTEGAK